MKLAAGAAGFVADAAKAQAYPARPITIIVPYAAGGPADALARVVSERMRAVLGQPIIIENVAGASGTIGVTRAVRAAPNGYTLSLGHVGSHVVNGALFPLPFDLLKDLEPVALLPSNSLFIVGRKNFPADNLKDLIAWLKANPGKATAGTSGAGGGSHVTGVYFANATGTQFQFVPYRGTGPAMTDLIAGQIDIMFDQASNSASAGSRPAAIKAYAVTSATRLPSAPEIPTSDEAGLPGFHMAMWHGMWAPKGTPKDIIAKLNDAAVETLADPGCRQAAERSRAQDIPAREQQTPEAFGAYHKAEIEKWWPIIKAAGIKPE